MPRVQIFQVDAFTRTVFSGNPAAICPLADWLDDATLQAIAAENNLAETAFFVREGADYQIRWFTPSMEVDLCGHATLASAFVLLTILEPKRYEVTFGSRSGPLRVSRDGDLLAMDFPVILPEPCTDLPDALAAGLGHAPQEVLTTPTKLFAIYARESTVRAIKPDMVLLSSLHPQGVAVTAPGNDVQYVSRYFAPSRGIPEDPVNGSSHCTLIPHWAGKLGKGSLHARQASARSGEIYCTLRGDRVQIAGHAALYLEGTITI